MRDGLVIFSEKDLRKFVVNDFAELVEFILRRFVHNFFL